MTDVDRRRPPPGAPAGSRPGATPSSRAAPWCVPSAVVARCCWPSLARTRLGVARRDRRWPILLMIFLHELGHFLTAKRAGMKVTEFFLGFGPRIWSFRRGETEYGVKAHPAGAYVRIIGMNNLEEVDPADEARTYRQQAVPGAARRSPSPARRCTSSSRSC